MLASHSRRTADGNTAGDDGAYIYNTAGTVGVDHSFFDGNQKNGLEAFSGNLSFLDVDASGNQSDGAYIDSGGTVSIDPSTFNGNQQYGLSIPSSGDVTLFRRGGQRQYW